MRVIKLGGSLLDIPNLADRFERWYGRQPPITSIVVVGGGAAADMLREMDRANPLDASTAHWLAIRAMQFNARIVQAFMPTALWAESFDQMLSCNPSAGVLIADPWKLLTEAAAADALPLPESWDVTSDSISAWVATEIGAEELVLLKSTLPPTSATAHDALACGYVDPYFREASASVAHIRCINMRGESLDETILRDDQSCNVPQRDL